METTPYKTEDYLDTAQITDAYLKEYLDVDAETLSFEGSDYPERLLACFQARFARILIALNRRIAKLEGVKLDD